MLLPWHACSSFDVCHLKDSSVLLSPSLETKDQMWGIGKMLQWFDDIDVLQYFPWSTSMSLIEGL